MIVGLIWKWAVVSGVFMAAAALLPDVKVKSWGAAAGAALVFGVTNAVLGWLLTFVAGAILFLPKLLTFGLLGLLVPLVVNAALLKLTDVVVEDDLDIEGVRGLLCSAAAVTAASAFLY